MGRWRGRSRAITRSERRIAANQPVVHLLYLPDSTLPAQLTTCPSKPTAPPAARAPRDALCRGQSYWSPSPSESHGLHLRPCSGCGQSAENCCWRSPAAACAPSGKHSTWPTDRGEFVDLTRIHELDFFRGVAVTGAQDSLREILRKTIRPNVHQFPGEVRIHGG